MKLYKVLQPVSYTHLDVYKRQGYGAATPLYADVYKRQQMTRSAA